MFAPGHPNYLPAELAAQILEQSSRYQAMPAHDVPLGAARCNVIGVANCLRIAHELNEGAQPCEVALYEDIDGPPVELTPIDVGAGAWAVVDMETISAPEVLTDAQRELLANTIEECAEASQRCTKILRFGMRRNPYTGEHNQDALERELGDVLAMMEALHQHNLIDREKVLAMQQTKLGEIAKPNGRLRYAKVTL